MHGFIKSIAGGSAPGVQHAWRARCKAWTVPPTALPEVQESDTTGDAMKYKRRLKKNPLTPQSYNPCFAYMSTNSHALW